MMKPLLEPRPAVEIKRTPGVCGGSPCVGNRRVTVHGLVIWRRLGLSDEEIIDAIQGLTADELRAAWRYYDAHPDEINALIEEEEAA
jgi:uncharacterized protein (DUF433 family)